MLGARGTRFFLTSYELLSQKRTCRVTSDRQFLQRWGKQMLNSWARAGLRPVVAQRVEDVYPNYEITRRQREILEALSTHKQLMIRDLPGQGKSFLLAIWALASDRAMRDQEVRTTTTVLVHTMELAHQYYEWIARLVGDTQLNVDEIVQQVTYGPASMEYLQNETLLKTPFPHILIATPERLRLMLNDARFVDKFDSSSLHRIVVDEADQMITFPENRKMSPSEELDIRTANTPLELLLQHLQHLRKPSSSEGLGAIWCSATLNSKFRLGLVLKGWGTESNHLLKFVGAGRVGGNDFKRTTPEDISHHVMYVDGEQGVEDAKLPKVSLDQIVSTKELERAKMNAPHIIDDAATRSTWKTNASRTISNAYYNAITDIFKAEEGSIGRALVLFASDTECTSAIDALRSLSYTTEHLHFPIPEASCKVLVSTVAGARGLNIPGLTHVFHIGPLAQTNDYVHCAGKLRRLGQSEGPAKSFTLLCKQDNLAEMALRLTKIGLHASIFFTDKGEVVDDSGSSNLALHKSKHVRVDDGADSGLQSHIEYENGVENHAPG